MQGKRKKKKTAHANEPASNGDAKHAPKRSDPVKQSSVKGPDVDKSRKGFKQDKKRKGSE